MPRLSTSVNTIACIAIAVVALVVFSYNAWSLYQLELSRNGRGYVTDEVWYVSASRVILQKIFGFEVKQDPENYGATIVFASKPSIDLSNIANYYGVSIRQDYAKLNAVYVYGAREKVYEFIDYAKRHYSVVDVIPGWQLPDNEGINNYINYEHPPLAKYLIALVMLLIGDNPVYWRIPVIAFGVAASILVYLTLYVLTRRIYVAIAGSLLFIVDTMSRALFSIAILDGFVATLTTLALYYAVKSRYKEALFTGVIAGLFKATGIFASIPAIILSARRVARERGEGLAGFIREVIVLGVLTAVLYVSLLVVVSTPLIQYMGLYNWFKQSLLGSIGWHLSAKCTGAGCPRWSNPWDWFIGYNSFPLYIYPDGKTLAAEGFYPLWFTSLALAVLALPLVKHVREYGRVFLYFTGVFLCYIAIWLMGAKTQYSFYAVQLTPLVYVNLVYLIYLLLSSQELGLIIINSWIKSIMRLVKLFEDIILE